MPFYDRSARFGRQRKSAPLAPILGLAALVVRYRRGTDVARRQLLWLVLAVLVALTVTCPGVWSRARR